MTHSAQAFLGPLTLQTLTRRRPMTDPLELLPDQRIAHIVAADSADLILVAPATARWIAAMAAGLADDVITATCLASTAPVVVAPAMDGEMYAHPATVANVEKLRSFGYAIVEPEYGPLASGAGRPGQAGGGRRRSSPRLIGRWRVGRSDSPTRSQRPPASDSETAVRHGRLARGRHRRRHRRADRSQCATSATAPAARWASRSPRRPWRAGRA